MILFLFFLRDYDLTNWWHCPWQRLSFLHQHKLQKYHQKTKIFATHLYSALAIAIKNCNHPKVFFAFPAPNGAQVPKCPSAKVSQCAQTSKQGAWKHPHAPKRRPLMNWGAHWCSEAPTHVLRRPLMYWGAMCFSAISHQDVFFCESHRVLKLSNGEQTKVVPWFLRTESVKQETRNNICVLCSCAKSW